MHKSSRFAGVMELADVVDSKSTGSDTVPVRVRPPAPVESLDAQTRIEVLFFLQKIAPNYKIRLGLKYYLFCYK